MVRYWFAAALILTISSASAAALTICDAGSYVGDRVPGSLDIPVSLSEDGKTYPVRAMSAYTAGYSRNILCFQYQIVNVGTEAIPLAFWKLVDDYKAKDLNKQESRFRNRARPTSFDDPIKAPTKIKGLRAAETSAAAWQTVEDANKSKESSAGKFPVFSFAKASLLDPAVARAVQSGFLSDDDVAVLDYKAAQGEVAQVSDTIGSDSGFVYSNSGIDFKEKFSSYTYLKVGMGPKQTDGVQVRVFSPFLSALTKEPRETAQFLDAVSRFTKEPVPILTTSSSEQERLPSPNFASTQTFYVVEHPLTIEWLVRDDKGELKPSVQCVRIASYSPFPVSLNENFCVR
jgi:hypothetical protein